ncbi:hypothetical protein [Yersinia frederiksenii]|uniref:hypothetical protein n=1 Tax=Yersinia frederiksenii TaxID=29484 RepID=UPI0005E5E419|nr:hypothetical protein [Yersinia frederiksenii]CFR18121.1 Uncharacterised protein [Yersinia frederiksenii]
MMNVIEMHGLITGKCVAGDMFVNESVGEYLVRKIANIEEQRNAALNTCSLISEALGIKGAVAGDTIANVQQLVAENATLKSDAREVAIDAANSIAYAIFNLSDKTLNDLKPGIIDTTCPTGSALIAERNLREFAASLRGEQNAS